MKKNQSTSKVAVATTPSRQTESQDDAWKCSESRLPSLAVIFIFFSSTTLEAIFVCPWYVENYALEVWLSIVILLILTSIATIVNFSHASWMDPGYLPKAPDNRYLKTQPSLIKVNGEEIHLKHCRTCRYYRMPRTTHCSQCDHCVDHFDHHCPWVNNCVGRRNYRFFFGFLCCLTSHIIVSTSICIYYLLKLPGDFYSDWSAHKVIALTVTVVAVLIFIPVCGLLCFHVFLVSKGLSTYEYVSKKYKGKHSPFDMGPFQNCVLQLCGAEYPVFKPPDFSIEDNNNESQSQEVQRDLVVKFAKLNSKTDKDKDAFPSKKKLESSQTRSGTGDANANNNTRLEDDNGSVDSGNVFCGDGEGSSDNEDNAISLQKGEHVATIHSDPQIVLNIFEDEGAKYAGCDDSFSIVDESGVSFTDGSGDIWGPIENLVTTTVDDTIH